MQWDKVENKTTVLVYAGGSIIALWLSSSIVGAVNAVPLVRPHNWKFNIQIHSRLLPAQ